LHVTVTASSTDLVRQRQSLASEHSPTHLRNALSVTLRAVRQLTLRAVTFLIVLWLELAGKSPQSRVVAPAGPLYRRDRRRLA
jgi:hypothetical protein